MFTTDMAKLNTINIEQNENANSILLPPPDKLPYTDDYLDLLVETSSIKRGLTYGRTLEVKFDAGRIYEIERTFSKFKDIVRRDMQYRVPIKDISHPD
jgi:hypothetical protein